MNLRQNYQKLKNLLRLLDLNELSSRVIELNNLQELKKVFDLKLDPIIDDDFVSKFNYVEDVNERRLRDAEALGTVCRNMNIGNMLEIGTSTGQGTALMASNAPDAHVYTVNIPPEQIQRGEGGSLTTISLSKQEIGSYYREKGLKNITQVYGNSANWEPYFEGIQVAFIDGCHDSEFVYNDSCKALSHMRPGSFILWHDFHVELGRVYPWIYSVCMGVAELFRNGILKGRIYHLCDSWIGIYRVGNDDRATQ